jgi:hypothetical protein
MGWAYTIAPFDRSAAYVAALPWLTGRRVELPDHPRLLARSAARARRAGVVRCQRLRIRRRNAKPAMPASTSDAPSNPHGVSVGALAAALAHVPT